MKNLVRGGIILSMLSVFVIFIYAQTQTEEILSSANDSQNEDSNFNKNLFTAALTKEFNTAESNSNKSAKSGKPAAAESKPVVQPEPTQEQNKTEAKKAEGNKVEKTVLSKAVNAVSRGAFIATAYCLKGRTAMGHAVRSGLIAADPRVLRLGSKVNIDAGKHSGSYLVSDTGGSIKGRRIDIWMASCADAKRFGRRTVTISQ